MKRIQLYLILLLAALIPCAATAQTKSSGSETSEPVKLGRNSAKAAASAITSSYKDWKSVTLTGKLHLDDLPISPTVKIYMVRDKSIVISMSAPLLGEVGTAEITTSKFTIVNKMKKRYCREDISDLVAGLPISLSDLQNIFLARIFLPNYGTLSMKNYTHADFYTDENVTGWLVLPTVQPVEYDVSCAYTALPDGRTSSILVMTLDGEDQANAIYEYDGKRTDIFLNVTYKHKERNFAFTINSIDYKGKPVKPAEITNKYKQVNLRDFFRHLL